MRRLIIRGSPYWAYFIIHEGLTGGDVVLATEVAVDQSVAVVHSPLASLLAVGLLERHVSGTSPCSPPSEFSNMCPV
jgi:hypothetical protein